MLKYHLKWLIFRVCFLNFFFKEAKLERNVPIGLKKMYCFEQFAIFSALYLGSMVPENNMFCRRANVLSEQAASDKSLLYCY